MRARLAWLSLLLVLGAAPAAAGTDEIFPDDPRVIEANSLLDDEQQYPRVISLYREVLRENPDDDTTRHWLARVLSWKGENDAALTEYERLLAHPPAAEEVKVERAEVLSWAGRLDEAEQAFADLLAADPGDARATRGLARVYSWTGRSSEASTTYERALSLHDDVEARRELSLLKSSLGSGADGGGQHFRDSDGYRFTSFTASSTSDLDFDTRVIASVLLSRASIGDDLAAQLPAGTPRDTDGVEASLGLSRRFGADVEAKLAGGYQWWQHAPGHPLVRGSVDYDLRPPTHLGLDLEYAGFLSRCDSFGALDAGLSQTSLGARVRQNLPQRWSTSGHFESSFVSDSNVRLASSADVEWQPIAGQEITTGLVLDHITYTRRDPLYYTPEQDVSASFFGRGGLPIASWLVFEVEASVGLGYASELDLDGFGLNYALSGGPQIHWRGLRISLFGSRMQSQRASTYTSHGFGASAAMEF